MKYLIVLLFASVGLSEVLKCHEDNIEPKSEGYKLNPCDESTKFCAVLSNTKTKEVFRACAMDKMCQHEGSFNYQQHPELHIDCCKGDGCNEAFGVSLGSGALTLSLLFTFLFH